MIQDNTELTDPTAFFCKAVLKSARDRGNKIAGKLYEGNMAIVMGKIFGDIIACGVMGAVSNSLWDTPMV